MTFLAEFRPPRGLYPPLRKESIACGLSTKQSEIFMFCQLIGEMMLRKEHELKETDET